MHPKREIKRINFILRSALSIIALLVAVLIKGQDSILVIRDSKLPQLGDHTFITTSGSRSPHMTTNFFTYIGYGKTEDFYYPVFQVGDWKAFGLKGSVVFVDVVASYQQRIRDWISLYMKYNFAGRLGTDIQSALGHGFNTITSFEVGWKIKLIEFEKAKITATIELQNHNGSFFNIAGYTKDVINNNPFPQLRENIPVLTGSGGLQYAYGINDLFGLMLFGDFTYGETYTRGENAIRFSAGTSIDMNLYKRYNTPIGIAFTAALTSEPDLVYVDGRVAKLMFLKVVYTGGNDFTVGLEIGGLFSPMPGAEDDPFVSTVGLASRFYF